jgi:hypothetical protein
MATPAPVAWLIYATVNLSGFPAQQHTAIEWPSLEICEAKAREFKHALAKPEAKLRREVDQIAIIVAPACVSTRPAFWIEGPRS